ncbi:uncharacterized protein LOC117507517 [Thalassophryne amazonica]|uniref:uncharacterized protein LOC117507517 n=1 Tax=Thalassophryne amazonica TaxID=390379 RepID=UPI001471AB6D|nr:uncharacterized protein LOC117507517 [Thalassophryne amazonica]
MMSHLKEAVLSRETRGKVQTWTQPRIYTVEEMECKICYNLYNSHSRKPKVLSCLHRICAKCLNKMLDMVRKAGITAMLSTQSVVTTGATCTHATETSGDSGTPSSGPNSSSRLSGINSECNNTSGPAPSLPVYSPESTLVRPSGRSSLHSVIPAVVNGSASEHTTSAAPVVLDGAAPVRIAPASPTASGGSAPECIAPNSPAAYEGSASARIISSAMSWISASVHRSCDVWWTYTIALCSCGVHRSNTLSVMTVRPSSPPRLASVTVALWKATTEDSHDGTVRLMEDDQHLLALLSCQDQARPGGCGEVVLSSNSLSDVGGMGSIQRSSDCLVITIMDLRDRSSSSSDSLSMLNVVSLYHPPSLDSLPCNLLTQKCCPWTSHTLPRCLLGALCLVYFSSLPLGIYLLMTGHLWVGVVLVSLVPSTLLMLVLYGFCQCLCQELMEVLAMS